MAAELDIDMPPYRAFGGKLNQALRYGENPHQQAGFYAGDKARKGVATARQIQGKALSFNNINDTDAAFELVRATLTALPAPLSNTPTRAASRLARPQPMHLPKHCAAIRSQLLAALLP